MRLDTLISGLDVASCQGSDLSRRICDLTEDSRTVMPGSLFVARRGTRADGRAFVDAAIRAGAAAVLTDDAGFGAAVRGTPVLCAPDVATTCAIMAERFYGEPTARLALAGVTGTKGKTTVAWLIHGMLNRAGLRCGLIGTVCVDDGSEVAPALLTTPPAIELSRTMARMLDCGCRAAAIEVSSHALHQRRTAGLRFRVGVFTNLAHDHLDYHQTPDRYAAAKAMLFEALPEASRGGIAVVNAHDPASERMVRDCRASVTACGVTVDGLATEPLVISPDRLAHIRRQDASGMDVSMEGPWGRWDLRLPLAGPHNALNALQAATAAVALGLAPSEVEAGLAAAAAPPGRLEPVTAADAAFAVYVDYAHTEDSLRRILQVARGFTLGRLIAVFGCGGDRDRAKRAPMGSAATEVADQVFITSDNPRTEDPGTIIKEIMAGVAPDRRARVTVEQDRRRAIRAAIGAARDGDTVVIAGKGHEDAQIVAAPGGGTVKRHFDDREEARAALRARGGDERQRTAGRPGHGAEGRHP